MRSLTVALLGLASLAHAAPKVLVCEADVNMGAGTTVQQGLQNTGAFAQVDLLDCGGQTPSLNQLQQYQAVFVWDDAPFADRNGLGNNLADYVDAGGGVVQAMFTMLSGFELQGRWAGTYNCIQPGAQNAVKGLAFQPNEPGPLTQGVTTISANNASTGSLAQGAVSVWDYNNMEPAIARCAPGGHKRVDLNFYPNNNNTFGDWVVAVKNALLFTAGGGNPVSGKPNPVAFPDTGTGAISTAVTVTFTNGSMSSQTVNGATIGGTNAGDFTIVQAPQWPVTLAANATTSVQVAFQPTVAGARNATLSLSVANQMSTSDVALSGKAVQSSIVVAPSPLNFGGTQIGTPVTKDLTITNNGNAALNVNDAQITSGQSAYSFINPPLFPVSVPAGVSFSLTVQFSPQQNGITKGTIAVSSSDTAAPTLIVPLSGYAGPPAIDVDLATVIFAATNLGATSPPITVNVMNTGFSDLTVTDVSLGGNNPGDFVLDKKALPGIIPALMQSPIVLSFKPTTTGQRSATVTIQSNAGSKVLNLFATGTTASLMVAPMSLDFGMVKVKVASAPQNITVSNSGSGTLKVMSVDFSDAAFAVASGPKAPFTVGPNASVDVGVACTPAKSGAIAGTATVTTDVGQAQVTLACTGIAPILTATPNPVDFGKVFVGTTSPEIAVTVKNTGTDDLNISFFNVSGPDAGDFSSNDLPNGAVLPPGGTQVVHFTFTPSRGGPEMASLDMLTDDPQQPNATVPITGSGEVAGIDVQPQEVDFGNVPVGNMATKPVTITNTGDASIDVNSITIAGPNGNAFSVDNHGPLTIGVGQSATVNVTFAPLIGGMASGSLTTTPSQLPPVVIQLKGTGVAPMVTVSPLTLDFGMVTAGSPSDPKLVTVKNTGSQPITIDKILSSDPQFTVDQTMTKLTLKPNEYTTFAVVFTPADAVGAHANITIALANSSKPIAQVSASGLGIPAPERNMPGGCSCSLASARPPLGAAALFALVLLPLAILRRRRAR